MAVLLVLVVLANHQVVWVVAADEATPVVAERQFLVQTNLTYLVLKVAELVIPDLVVVVVTKVVAVVVLHKLDLTL